MGPPEARLRLGRIEAALGSRPRSLRPRSRGGERGADHPLPGTSGPLERREPRGRPWRPHSRSQAPRCSDAAEGRHAQLGRRRRFNHRKRPKENQDAAIAFEVNSTAVLAVADGPGGPPAREGRPPGSCGGSRRSSAAEALGTSPAVPAHPGSWPGKLLDSAAAFCRQARQQGGRTPDGFRSTLIVVVGTPSTYGYCYLGDGGGVVVWAGDDRYVPRPAEGRRHRQHRRREPRSRPSGNARRRQAPRRAGDNSPRRHGRCLRPGSGRLRRFVVRLLGSHDGDAQAVASSSSPTSPPPGTAPGTSATTTSASRSSARPPLRATAPAVTVQRPALAGR
ncbi:MAG: protein phosphatase 2C domain-containing protein [Holophagales bacterium]|nr:protein phosphatase 2C domain-containing protein [Holophagales bacterium]